MPIEELMREGGPSYSKEDFEKDSRAVCAAGDDPSTGMVLWWDGAWLDREINEVGQGLMLEDLGLYEAPAGISIWEGHYVTRRYDSPVTGTDYETEAVGDFRDLTQSEWVALLIGENPLEVDFDAAIDVTVVDQSKVERLTMTWGTTKEERCGG